MQDKENFKLNVAVSKSFSYLEYHTDGIIKASTEGVYFTPYSFIRKIEFDNDTDQDYEDLILQLEFSDPIFTSHDVHTGVIPRREKTVFQKDLQIQVDQEKLYHQNGVDTCTLYVSLVNPADNTEVASISKTVKILPLTQCSDDISHTNELLAKYCVCETPSLIEVEKQAIREHEGQPLIGYQNKDNKNAIIQEISCIYRALHKYQGLAYSNPPNSTEIFQNIRLPQVVLKNKIGTCLDLSLLMCSCLLQVGLYPILILIDGHAFVGCFLTEYDSFNSLVETKPNVVYSDAIGEDKSLVLIECTTFVASCNVPFTSAMEMAQETLRAYRGSFAAVDIYRCQQSYFKPIPIINEEGNIDFTIPTVEMKPEEVEDLNTYQGQPLEESETADRFSTWEKKLLDLSPANHLVNFTPTANNSATLLPNNGLQIFDYLKRGKGSFHMRSFVSGFSRSDGKKASVDDEGVKGSANGLFNNGILTTSAPIKSIKELIRKDTTSREETGSPTLYLTIGMLYGYDPIDPKEPEKQREIAGPFLLLPVRIRKDHKDDDFLVSYDFDDLMVNKTFLEYYKLKKGVNYDNLYGVSSANRFEDILATFRANHESDVVLNENSIYIANFSFSHMVMWQDIVSRKDALKENPIIKSLIENQSYIENEPIEYEHVDELDTMADFAAPLPYDSTQLRAIRECAKGNSFILDGPPGTGKSQTIVNMIVNAFYHNKTVLFVAEKQAALEVVRQRLASLGLDQFALQLYSNNTNKASLFSQLGKVMDLGKQASEEDFSKNCAEIEKEKTLLNQELKKLHSRKKYFYSLYEAITRKLSTDDVTLKLHFDHAFISKYDGDINEEIRNILDFLVQNYEKYDGSEEEIYLSYLRIDHLTYQEQLSLNPTFEKVSDAFDTFNKSYLSFVDLIKEASKPTKQGLENNLFFYDYALLRKTNLEALADPDYFANPDSIMDSLSALKELKSTYRNIKDRYVFDGITKVNGNLAKEELAKGTNIFNRGKAKKKALAIVSPMLLNGDITPEEIRKAADTAVSVNELYSRIRKSESLLDSFFATNILSDFDQDDEYADYYQNTAALYQELEKGRIPDYVEKYQRVKAISPMDLIHVRSVLKDTLKDYQTYQDTLKEAMNLFPFEEKNIGYRDYFKEWEDFYTFFVDEESQRKVYDFAKINSSLKRLKELGAGNFADAIENREIPLEEVKDTYEHALSTSFVTCYFTDDEFNNDFDENRYNAEIEKYQSLIKKYNSLCVGETIEKITSRFADPNLERSSTSPIGALRKLVMSSGRGITIRNTLTNYEDLIRMYFPCFLMSPLAAAQYLDVNSRKFDIVIFDEASQIPTYEAVGPIARGNALVVAGDPMQMPPTNYFNMNVSSVDENLNGSRTAIEDAESLLDDCLAIGMPRIRLAFHYRSRHESLIQFSNMNFYGGDLFTFPSRDNATSHISFLHVDAINKRKSSEISDEEIKAILSVLDKLLSDEKTCRKTMGIIVFNTKQQMKLYDEVDDYLNRHPKYLALTHWNEDASTEKLFIKNLENVQGDERDIIIMSIGFSKNEEGKALISGPLTLDKGERRLNVAASRSKEQMIVISTIYCSDIDADNRKNNGAKALKIFLNFAEKASMPMGDEIIDSPNKDLAFFIAKELRLKGYDCDISVGSSEFKVDLAIRKKDSKDYLLGILLDEKPLNANISCRDRFYVEPIMLHSLHWKILRVYTYSFLRFKEDTIKSIIRAIEETSADASNDLEKFVPPVMTDHNIDREHINYGTKPYESYTFTVTDYIPYENMETDYYDPNSVELIKRIIAKESPISLETLKNYFRKAYNLKQLSNKANIIINNQINNARLIRTEDYRHRIFLWDPNKGVKVDCFRTSDRDILEIPKEEIIFLMNKVIKVYQTIDKEDLIRNIADVMGIDTLTSRVRGKLEYTLDYAIHNRLLIPGYQENY